MSVTLTNAVALPLVAFGGTALLLWIALRGVGEGKRAEIIKAVARIIPRSGSGTGGRDHPEADDTPEQ